MKRIGISSILLPAVFFLAFTANRAYSISTGDQFIITATDTSPNGQYTEYEGNAIATAGALADLDSLPLSSTPHPTDPGAGQTVALSITLGNPVSPNLFGINSFTNVFGTPLLMLDLSGVSFDAATLDLKGDVTGSFVGGGGGLNYFDLRLFNDGTWIYLHDHTGISATTLGQIGPAFTDVSSGTYFTAAAPVPEPTMWIDIRPGDCENPLNVKSKGVLPVAILGTSDFNVTTLDPTSFRLVKEPTDTDGVAPIKSSVEDVATPPEAVPTCQQTTCSDTGTGPDGHPDLTLKFKTQDVVKLLGDVSDGDCVVLYLKDVVGKTLIGQDVVLILKKGKMKGK